MRTAVKGSYVPELRVFFMCKLVTPGRFVRGDVFYNALCNELGLQDRTVHKRLMSLVRLGYARHDNKSGAFFIESTATMMKKLYGRRNKEYVSLKACINDIKNFPVLAFAVVDSQVVNNYRTYVMNEYRKRELEYEYGDEDLKYAPLPSKGFAQVAGQTVNMKKVEHNYLPTHYGVSNEHIGRLFGRTSQWASSMKKRSAQSGYIKYSHVFRLIGVYDHNNKNDMAFLNIYSSMENKKFRFFTAIDENGNKKIALAEQLHDEIISQFKYRMHNYDRLNHCDRVNKSCEGSGDHQFIEMDKYSTQFDKPLYGYEYNDTGHSSVQMKFVEFSDRQKEEKKLNVWLINKKNEDLFSNNIIGDSIYTVKKKEIKKAILNIV